MQMLSQLSYRPSGRRRIARAGRGARARRPAPYDGRMPTVPHPRVPATSAGDPDTDRFRVVPFGDLAVLALLGDAATAERHAAAAAEALALAAERLATAPGA